MRACVRLMVLHIDTELIVGARVCVGMCVCEAYYPIAMA